MTESEQRFVDIIERIPLMEEKLDRLLLAFDKMMTQNTLVGIRVSKEDDDEIPVFYSEEIAKEDRIREENYHKLNAQAKKLKEEANAIGDELGFTNT